MKTSTKNTLIAGIFALVTAVIGALAGLYAGGSYEKNKQNDYVQSQVVDISGDHNTVSINSVDELLTAYNKLSSDYETLKEQNNENFNNYKELKSENETLSTQLGDAPVLELKDLSLSINGDEMPVNSTHSLAVIDGREYVSKDFLSNLIDEDEVLTFKNNTAYIGQVVEDRANLFDMWIVKSDHCFFNQTTKDSYGNKHTNSIITYNNNNSANVVYNLNRKYTYLNIFFAASESFENNATMTINIYADDTPIYSETISKTSEPIRLNGLEINKCSLLKIEISFSNTTNTSCIIADASVYN